MKEINGQLPPIPDQNLFLKTKTDYLASKTSTKPIQVAQLLLNRIDVEATDQKPLVGQSLRTAYLKKRLNKDNAQTEIGPKSNQTVDSISLLKIQSQIGLNNYLSQNSGSRFNSNSFALSQSLPKINQLKQQKRSEVMQETVDGECELGSRTNSLLDSSQQQNQTSEPTTFNTVGIQANQSFDRNFGILNAEQAFQNFLDEAPPRVLLTERAQLTTIPQQVSRNPYGDFNKIKFPKSRRSKRVNQKSKKIQQIEDVQVQENDLEINQLLLENQDLKNRLQSQIFLLQLKYNTTKQQSFGCTESITNESVEKLNSFYTSQTREQFKSVVNEIQLPMKILRLKKQIQQYAPRDCEVLERQLENAESDLQALTEANQYQMDAQMKTLRLKQQLKQAKSQIEKNTYAIQNLQPRIDEYSQAITAQSVENLKIESHHKNFTERVETLEKLIQLKFEMMSVIQPDSSLINEFDKYLSIYRSQQPVEELPIFTPRYKFTSAAAFKQLTQQFDSELTELESLIQSLLTLQTDIENLNQIYAKISSNLFEDETSVIVSQPIKTQKQRKNKRKIVMRSDSGTGIFEAVLRENEMAKTLNQQQLQSEKEFESRWVEAIIKDDEANKEQKLLNKQVTARERYAHLFTPMLQDDENEESQPCQDQFLQTQQTFRQSKYDIQLQKRQDMQQTVYDKMRTTWRVDF